VAVLPIVIGAENPVLRKKTTRAKAVTKELKKLLKDMIETMDEASGVGIAAPQVGKSIRACITVIGGKKVPMINPLIVKRSEETAVDQEGCLSLPNVWLDIARAKEIVVDYVDTNGKKQQRALKDFDARVVQHEVDHLDGVLIVDYAPAVVKNAKK
jgi:peptide deformylase